MFTGIIEDLSEVVEIKKIKNNLHILCKSKITNELKIDQSLSHNGICLTVVDIDKDIYKVIAVKETLKKTNLSLLKKGDKINIERSLTLNSRIDGHIVQGHVDQVAECVFVKEEQGSHIFKFKYNKSTNILVEKGSVCVNGVSLTVFDCCDSFFSVAIIPYTFANTSFCNLKVGSIVNIEFDILGKYVSKIMKK